MAKRPAWSVNGGNVICKEFEFKWNSGFTITQKQKNISNFHASIYEDTKKMALEVSSKGREKLGKKIGAFSLKYNNIPLENIFQSSKKFEQGGPYKDLLSVSPKKAKQDERIRKSGNVIAFFLDDDEWPIEPKTLFYDYIYVLALIQNYGYDLNMDDYEWFTDIEFNPQKSINCQARSVAIYKLLQQEKLWDCLENKERWKKFHMQYVLG